MAFFEVNNYLQLDFNQINFAIIYIYEKQLSACLTIAPGCSVSGIISVIPNLTICAANAGKNKHLLRIILGTICFRYQPTECQSCGD